MKKYELIDHTADIGLKANGKTLSEAFENASLGMFKIISDSKISEIGEYKIQLTSQNIEQLLVDFLSELLFIHEVQKLMFKRCTIKINQKDCSLEAIVFGEAFNENKHEIMEIKAVTYHMLEVKKNDLYKVQVLFDI